MSKRRTRDRQPNIPTDALQRAREQAGLPATPDEIETPAPAEVAASVETAAPKFTPNTASGAVAARRRKVGSAQLDSAKRRGQTDQDKVKYLLENPTKTVTEAELRKEYFHVLIDLRNMGLLAAVLIGILVLLAQVI
jgi:hypothetical protein